MSEPEARGPAGDEAVDANATAVQEESSPPVREPWVWTPERIIEWNRYYDLYVAATILLLVFISAAHLITGPSALWSNLATGRLIQTSGAPITTDPFSYTMQGQPWINVEWLFQWVYALVYDFGAGLGLGSPDQMAAGLLVALTALARALTAWFLLQVRYRSASLWWSALCVGLALAAMLMPAPGSSLPYLPILGGIAGPADVSPTTWGVLFLAIEVWLIHRALRGGKPGSLWALPFLFALWANVDTGFLFGLVVLALSLIDVLPFVRRARAARRGNPARPNDEWSAPGENAPKFLLGVIALLVSAAACLANPSIHLAYYAAARPVIRFFDFSGAFVTQDQLAFFGPRSWEEFNSFYGGAESGGYLYFVVYYFLAVGMGAASFVLNAKRFSPGRFLVFAMASVAWACLRLVVGPYYAVIWAVTLSLNGQEWFLDRFGAVGRTSLGWRTWSVGGRAVTLLVTTALLVKGLTGYGAAGFEPVFGFGVINELFPFEAADFLAEAKIKGRVLNLNLASGDALIWRAWSRNPERGPFIDGRDNLYPISFRMELEKVRAALVKGDRDGWKPMLDQYGISVVLVPVRTLATPGPLFQGLANSPDWVPIYDDGNIVLFGRADASEEDLAYFTKNRLDAENLAFHVDRPVPSPARPPTPTNFIDRFFPNNKKFREQPHVSAADRWVTLRNPNPDAPPDIAHCLMAIRELRSAIASDPDDYLAWRVLSQTYNQLRAKEIEILTRDGEPVPVNYLAFRGRQMAATYNFAIQSSPPPRTSVDRLQLAQLRYQLAELYLSNGVIDLARDQLIETKALLPADAWSVEDQTRLDQLGESVNQVNDLIERATEEGRGGPIELAQEAANRGCLGLAIELLYDTVNTIGAQGTSKAVLLDFYCTAGWPDRALEQLDTSAVQDPALNTGPGTSSYRQGLIYLLIGSYDVAANLWGSSIRQIREATGSRALQASRILLSGQAFEAAEAELELPEQVATQAEWEAQLGLVLLEGGVPTQAGPRLESALKLLPDKATRPLIAAYLERLGLTVPPLAEKPEGAPEEPEAKKADDKPAEPDAEAKKADDKPAEAEAKKAGDKPAEAEPEAKKAP